MKRSPGGRGGGGGGEWREMIHEGWNLQLHQSRSSRTAAAAADPLNQPRLRPSRTKGLRIFFLAPSFFPSPSVTAKAQGRDLTSLRNKVLQVRRRGQLAMCLSLKSL